MTSSRAVRAAATVDGDVRVPGDKSISHRALILGALARGRSYIGNVSPAADVAATASALRACGGMVRDFGDGRIALDGNGPGRSLVTPDQVIDCANSGTTMRLLAGVAAGSGIDARFDGDASLRRRPMERVADPLRALGATVDTSDGHAPLTVRGTPTPRAMVHRLDIASAQVKSAILLASLTADGPTTVVEPQPTRDHTERLLRACGVAVATDGSTVVLTPSSLEPFGLRVPGDLSSAAFFLVLAASRTGWRVRCPGVGLNPGRTGILDVLVAMGARLTVEEDDPATPGEPTGVVAVEGTTLHGVDIGAALVPRCIDELPAIAVLATQAEGRTTVSGAEELRHKESDRLALVVAGLRALGADVEETGDGMVITGPTPLRAARVHSHRDHRLAMAWAVAACLVRDRDADTVIEDAACVAVSYPRFFEDLAHLTR